MSMLPTIPLEFKGAIVIAQHMPEKFTLSFARRLDTICPLTVTEAEQGDILQNGRIYVAPGGKHIKIINRDNTCFSIEITDKPVSSVFIPSVEILFRSLLESAGNQWLGVMLTGMGSDGAPALSDLRKMGGHTIVESEDSCVVFGMPRKVIEMDGAEFTLHENRIAAKIVELIENAECH
jgi:two-component system chemotaxis response regulator CheB